MTAKKPVAKRAVAKRAVAKPSPRKIAAKAAATMAKPKKATNRLLVTAEVLAKVRNYVLTIHTNRALLVELCSQMGIGARGSNVQDAHHDSYMALKCAYDRTKIAGTQPSKNDMIRATLIRSRSKPGTTKRKAGDGVLQTALEFSWMVSMRADWKRILEDAGVPKIANKGAGSKVAKAKRAAKAKKADQPFKGLAAAETFKARTPAEALSGAMSLVNALKVYRDANLKVLDKAVIESFTACADAVMKVTMPK